MDSTETMRVSLPTEICGLCVDRVLSESQTWLATGAGSRKIVLKCIDPDCIVGGALHPSVRDRLSRVRELAHGNVANLFGVERDASGAYLMWEYVEGATFDEFARAGHTPREIASVAREMVLAVDLLHMQGIVHGALIGHNAIVLANGTVRLTHVSPLLYTDPSVDIECIWNLLDSAADELGEQGAGLAKILADARAAKSTLRQLSSRLGALIDAREARKSEFAPASASQGARRRALFGAALATVLGLACMWGIRHAIETGHLASASSIHTP